mgnify:CR=1 FL=1
MIIKSISWKSGSFKKIYSYLHKKADRENQTLTYNLKPNEDIIKQFKENYEFTPKRKNGVIFYHEVLSFNAQDKDIQQQDLIYLAEEWLNLRAPKNLAYGIVHTHQANLHIHLIISSNAIREKTKHRLTKKEFKQAQLQLEQIQQEKFPHLTHSICQEPQKKDRNKYTLKEYHRYQRTKTTSKKDRLKSIIFEATQQPDFEKYLKSHNILIYQRGKNNGVVFENKRYRFNTLGFDPKLDLDMKKKREKEKQEQKPLTQREKNIKILQEAHKRDEERRKRDKDRGR